MTESTDFTPGKLFFSESNDHLMKVLEFFIANAIDRFYKRTFQGEIQPRQVIEITGNSPFPNDKLWKLVQTLGFDCFSAPDDAEWESKEHRPPDPDPPLFVIVGREDFDEDLLRGLISGYRGEDGTIYYLFVSQEDFFNYWLFGIEANYTPDDPHIDNHPGLKFLASLSEYPWPWPSTDAYPGTGEFDDSDLSNEHPLKARFGYSVSQENNYTPAQRQRMLDKALTTTIDPLPLQEVVEHIAWLIRTRKNMNRRNLAKAIAKWEADLAYLKKTYYRKQFKWPPTNARSW